MSNDLFQPGDEVESIWGDGYLKSRACTLWFIPSGIGTSVKINGDGTCPEINTTLPVIWHKATGHGPVTGERPKWVPTEPCWARVWKSEDGVRYAVFIHAYRPDSKCPYIADGST